MEYLVGAVLAALVTLAGTYLRFSGKIDSSEASDLWAESKSIREWSAERWRQCEEDRKELRSELSWSRERIAVLESRLGKVEQQTETN